MFYRAAKLHGTARTWLGCGRACFRLDDSELAERTLQEANGLDNREPQVWAYLALLNWRRGGGGDQWLEIAERCYRAAKVFGVDVYPDLLLELETTRAAIMLKE